MGRLAQNFPRFPHRCVIYKINEPTGFETEEQIAALKVVVWEGRCRKESNTSIRTFRGSEYVMKSDYRVQLGAVVGGNLMGDADAAPDGKDGEECGAVVTVLKAGMYVDVYERELVEAWEESISSSSSSSESSSSDEGLTPSFTMSLNNMYVGNLGTTLYCDEYKT